MPLSLIPDNMASLESGGEKPLTLKGEFLKVPTQKGQTCLLLPMIGTGESAPGASANLPIEGTMKTQ